MKLAIASQHLQFTLCFSTKRLLMGIFQFTASRPSGELPVHYLLINTMFIFDINIPDKPLTNIQLSTYAPELKILHFRGVFMRDTLPQYPYIVECGIVNLNTSNQAGSHWVCYYRNKSDRIYFDS